MPVDKFGRMSDLKTKDTGVSLTYINNNYVRSDGKTPLTGSLDMRGNTLYNVADPVNPQDVVSKIYVDNTKGSGVIGRKTKDGVSIKENMDFLGKQRIKNLPAPVDPKDAVSREYVENIAINHPFDYVDNTYQAKDDLDLKGNKIKNLCSPFEDGDAATKGYFDTQSVAFLKVDQGEYKAKADINLDKIYTVYNVKEPIDGGHVTNKKYVDEMDNLNSAFDFKNGSYYAKGGIIMKKNKLGGLREPLQDGEAATKKYVDDKTKNLFIDENDNIAFGLNVDMEGNQILGLPEPATDQEPATKKYVDDLQTQHVDEKGNIKFGRNVNLDNKRIFAMKEPKKANEGANKKYVDDTITKRLQEEKDNFLPQDPATKQYVDEAIKGLAGGDLLVSKEGVFIKANGHYRATAPLDIDNHKMENLPDPVDEKDAVNKKYIDGIVEALTLKQGLVRENGGFNLVDSYINMNFNRVRNIPYPHHNEDAVPRSFLENMINEVEEKIKKRTHLIAVSTYFCGKLIKGEYQFPFGGNACEEAGFLMPHSGRIKKVKLEIFGRFKRIHDYDPGSVVDIALEKEILDEIENVEELKKKPTTVKETIIWSNKLFKVLFLGGDLFSIIPFKNNSDEIINKPTGSILSTYSCVVKEPPVYESEIEEYERNCVFNYDLTNHPLSEGEVINIRTGIDRNVKSVFSFNFTFLIELDPL